MKRIFFALVIPLLLWGCNKEPINCSLYKEGIESKLEGSYQLSDLFYSDKLKTCVYEDYVDYFTTPDACGGGEYGISVTLQDIYGNQLSSKNGCPSPGIRLPELEHDKQKWDSKQDMKPYLSIVDLKRYSDIRDYLNDYNKYDELREALKR